MPGATIDGKAATQEGAEWFVEPGAHPSGGWIVLSNEDAAALKGTTEGHTLKMDDGTNAVTVKGVFISGREEYGAGLTKLSLVDLRHFWKYRKITAQYNVYNDDKKTFHSKTTPGGVAATGYAFKEIVDKLLEVLTDVPSGAHKPGTEYDADSLTDLDSGARPLLVDVQWEFVNAGEALAGILSIVGGTVSVSLDGDIVISMPEDDHWGSVESSIKEGVVSQTAKNAPNVAIEKPKQLNVCYRILREKLFKSKYWEAVMAHDGLGQSGQALSGKTAGEWLPVDEVLKDWGWSESEVRKKYYNKALMGIRGDGVKQRHWDHVRAQFYKFFRYNPSSSSDETRQQILPFHDEAGKYVEPLSGEAHHIRPYPYETAMAFDNAGDGIINGYAPIDRVRIEDERQGIIAFNGREPAAEVMEATSGNNLPSGCYELSEPKIQIVMPHLKKFQSTSGLQEDYYIAEDGYADAWTGLEDNGETERLLDDSQYYVEQDLEGTGTYTQLNQTDINARAKQYAEDYFKGFAVALKDKPYDVVAGLYSAKIKRLCGKLRYIQLSANSSSGYSSIFRVNNNKPLNPFSRNFVEGYGGVRQVGQTIQTVGPQFIKQPGGRFTSSDYAHNSLGLLSQASSVDYRPDTLFLDRHPVFINPIHVGLVPAQDLGFMGGGKKGGKKIGPKGKSPTGKSGTIDTGGSIKVGDISGGGGGKIDNRAKHTRVDVGREGIPATTFTHKFDETPNWSGKVWEATLFCPNQQGKKKKGGDKKDAPPPQLTGPGVSTGSDSGGSVGKTVPVPRKEKPGKASKAKPSGPDSTHVFLDLPEGNTTKKGPINNVFRICEHRPIGSDPDGHTKCVLGVHDKHLFHQTKQLCGPLDDDGMMPQPPPVGFEIYVNRIFDPGKKMWTWYGLVPICDTPVTPEPTGTPPKRPTPKPGPTPTPGGPGGGGKPPTGGGPSPVSPGPGTVPGTGASTSPGGTSGSGKWGDAGDWGGWPGLNPLLPYPPWMPPHPPGQVPPGTTGDDGLGGGTVDADGDPLGNEPPGATEPGSVPTPPPFGSGPGKTPNPDDYDPNGFYFGLGYHTLINPGEFVPPLGAFVTALPSHCTTHNVYNVVNSPEGKVRSPRFPGTGVADGVTFQMSRGSARVPGTAAIREADAARFQISAAEDPLDWSTSNRPTQSDYEGQTLGTAMADLYDRMATATDQIEALDGRSRANYNTQTVVEIPDGLQTVDYSPSTTFSSAPSAQATSQVDISGGVWNPGELSVSVAADGDGTYTFTVECENAPAGAQPVALDIKGPVPDTEDIDP